MREKIMEDFGRNPRSFHLVKNINIRSNGRIKTDNFVSFVLRIVRYYKRKQ